MSIECKLNEITKVLDSKYDKSNPKGYISGVNWGKIGGNIRWQVDLLNLINSEINSFGISLNDIAHWNEAYSWGDHALAGYGTSNFNPSDLLTDYGFTDNSADWNTAFSWGNHALAGYLTSFSETDPIFSASASAGIAGTDITNWNTAFGWGNHASAGYALSSALTGYVPYTGATTNLNMGVNKILTPRIDGTVATSNIQLGAAINIVADYNTYTLQKMSVGSGDMSAMFGVRGNSATTGTALLVTNSTPTTLLEILNNTTINLGGTLNTKHIVPLTHNSYDLGSSGSRIKDSYFSGAITARKINLTSVVVGDIPLLVKGMAGQTANLVEIQDSSLTNLFNISNIGAVTNTQTWNNIATVFTALDINITDTNSASSSMFLNLRTGGTSQLSISKFGQFTVANNPAIIHGSGVFSLIHGGVQHIRSNNVGTNIGTNTTISARLNVRSSSAVSGDCVVFENSSPSALFTVMNVGRVGIGMPTPSAKLSIGNDGAYNGALFVGPVGTNTSRIALLGNFEIVTNGSPSWTVQGFSIAGSSRTFEFIASSSNVTDNSMFSIRSGSSSGVFSNPIAGSKIFLNVGLADGANLTTFSPTSGNANYTILNLTSVLNQTGGANGITRGIYIAPTLTAAADYRAIEAITGNSSAHTLMKLNNGVQDVFCVKGDGKAGFFGVTPTSQQTMGASTAGATYTATEQVMIQKCWDVLRSFGLGN